MKTLCSFFPKFSSLIAWILSCFDRVIFKGHLSISRLAEFERFVDYVLKMRRVDFLKIIALQWSQRLVDHAKGFAQECGRTYEYWGGKKIDKDGWAKEQLRKIPSQKDWWASCA